MKVLFYNIAYGTGLNGSFGQYFWKVWRFIFLSGRNERNIIQLIKKVNADVVCLAEVDSGSLRGLFQSQAEKIAAKLNLKWNYSHPKYSPNSAWNYVPVIRKQCDAILANIKGDIRCHYLESGMKKLIQEYVVNGISIFTVHLSVLRKTVRKIQMEEIRVLLEKCPRPHILCGDFNIHKGLDEIQSFVKKTGLKLVRTPATFPSINPKKHIDLFFASPEIEVIDSGVLNVSYSDHLPVWIKVSPEFVEYS